MLCERALAFGVPLLVLPLTVLAAAELRLREWASPGVTAWMADTAA